MSKLSDLQKKLSDTDEQIVRLTKAAAAAPRQKADEVNLMSLRKRKQRLEEQIAGLPGYSDLTQTAIRGLSSVARKIADLVRVKGKTH